MNTLMLQRGGAVPVLALVLMATVPSAHCQTPPPEWKVEVSTKVTITGVPGGDYLVQFQADQPGAKWQDLTNVQIPASPYEFLDVAASTSTRSAYRVVALPAPPVIPEFIPRNMIWLPPGKFNMGSPTTESGRYPDEGPVTTVILTGGFYMSQCPVTQAEYESVMGYNPSRFKGQSNAPVEKVTWNDAVTYCAKLTQQERQLGRVESNWVYRLPTEAEFEYAARAGTKTRFSYGEDPSYFKLGNHAWYQGNSDFKPHPVGQKMPNPWHLYDMSGNVWQWCLDWYAPLPGGLVTNIYGATEGKYRVVRGGGWGSAPKDCRCADRSGSDPEGKSGFIGFRIVLAPGQL